MRGAFELSSQHHVLPWREALTMAKLDAARLGQAVTITRYDPDPRLREVMRTVFPDGSCARPRAAHRLPEDVGL